MLYRIRPAALLVLGLFLATPVAAEGDRDAFISHFRDKLDVGLEKRSGGAVDRDFRGPIYLATLKFDVDGLSAAFIPRCASRR